MIESQTLHLRYRLLGPRKARSLMAEGAALRQGTAVVQEENILAVSSVSNGDFDDLLQEKSLVLTIGDFNRGPIRRFWDELRASFQSPYHPSYIEWRASKNRNSPHRLIRFGHTVCQLRRRDLALSFRKEQMGTISRYVVVGAVITAVSLSMVSKESIEVLNATAAFQQENVLSLAKENSMTTSESAGSPQPSVTAMLNKEVASKPESIKPEKRIQYTNRHTWLRSKSNMKSPKVVRLKPSTSLTVYPEFPAPKGWVLAQKEAGGVGFIRTRYLRDTKSHSKKL